MSSPKDDFRKKTVKGLAWSTFSQVGKHFSMVLITIVLIRLLSPAEYGLITMILIISNFANILVDFGFGPAIIQKQDITQTDLSSVFWLNLMLGCLTTILVIVLAPFIAQFYETPLLENITYILAPIFFITSFNVVQRMLLSKNIDFKSLAKIELFAPIFAGIVAIVLAWQGWGVWSLVAQQLALFGAMAIALWWINPWRPTWEFSLASIKSMTEFSLNLFANQSLNYWLQQLDQIIIGKFYASADLGIYNRAAAFVLKPVRSVSMVINRVMFPSFSAIQDQKAKVAAIYLQIIGTITFVAFPAMVGLWAISQPFVSIVFGEQWIGIIPFLQIFCFVGMFQSINTLPDSVIYAMGRSDLAFKIGIFQKINTVIGVLIGLKWGMIGIAVGILISDFVNLWPKLYYGGKLVNLSVAKQLKAVIGSTLCTALMGAFVCVLQIVLEAWLPVGLLLVLSIVTGGLFYFMVAFALRLKPLEEGLKVLMGMRKKKVV